MSIGTHYNIAIAGAGIAGLSVAALLHEQGHTVQIVDQLERPSPIGSGLILQPTGLAVLERLGLLDVVTQQGNRINRLYGKTSTTDRIVLDVQYHHLGKERYGIAIHRATLFNALYNATSNTDIIMHSSAHVTHTEREADNKLSLHVKKGSPIKNLDLVIDALGIRSPLAGHADEPLPYGALWANVPVSIDDGFKPDALEQRYEKAQKMAGVLPIGTSPQTHEQSAAFFWSLKHSEFQNWKRRGLNAWKEDVLTLWPTTETLINHITHPNEMVMARYTHHTMKNPITDRLVHIGDSYHAASPQLGQGANMALLDAWALARALTLSTDIEEALNEYATSRRWHIRLYQMMSWMFTPVYQSDSSLLPLFRDLIAAPLSRMPPAPFLLASMVAGTLGTSLKRLELE